MEDIPRLSRTKTAFWVAFALLVGGLLFGLGELGLIVLFNPDLVDFSFGLLADAAIVVGFYLTPTVILAVAAGLCAFIFPSLFRWSVEKDFALRVSVAVVLFILFGLFSANLAIYRLCVPSFSFVLAGVYKWFFAINAVVILSSVAVDKTGFNVITRNYFIPGVFVALVLVFPICLFFDALGASDKKSETPVYSRDETGLKVLVIGIDGATWDVAGPLIDDGRLPAIKNLRERGSWGRLGSMTPTYSPVIWSSIATGKLPRDHGIVDYERFYFKGSSKPARVFPCYNGLVELESLGLAKRVPYFNDLRRAEAVWEVASAYGLPVLVVDWFPSTPPDGVEGAFVSDYLHLAYGKGDPGLSPADVIYPVGLFEYVSEPPVSKEDAMVSMREYLTGSSSVPLFREKSALTAYWTDLVYASATSKLFNRINPQLTMVYFNSIDVIGHTHWGFREEVALGTEEDRRKWGSVVDRTYEFTDGLIADILNYADESTVVIVVSDHGFTAVPWARYQYGKIRGTGHITGVHDTIPPPEGVIIMAGGPVVPGKKLDGADVFDIAPTILYLLGFPVADDMRGGVLIEAINDDWIAEHPVRRITTYEGLRKGPTVSGKPAGESDRTEMFKALGYF